MIHSLHGCDKLRFVDEILCREVFAPKCFASIGGKELLQNARKCKIEGAILRNQPLILFGSDGKINIQSPMENIPRDESIKEKYVMKKRLLSMLLVVCMLCSVLPMGLASASDMSPSGKSGDGLTWEVNLDSGELVISGTGPMQDYDYERAPWYEYIQNIKTVRIMEGVTSVGSWAFEDMTEITEVVFSDTVETIGSLAFYGCESLGALNLKEGLKNIHSQAFDQSGVTVVYLPASVEFIESNAFGSCRNLQKFVVAEGNPYYFTDNNGGLYSREDDMVSLVQCPGSFEGVYEILEGANQIWGWAFAGCTKLSDVVFPETVCSIDWYAFYGCTALTQLVLPASVSYIGHSFVDNCKALQKILVAEGSEYFCNDEEGVLFNKDMTELVRYPNGRIGHYDIPEGVVTIGRAAFKTSRAITSVSIPETVESIQSNAFYEAYNLTAIKLPESLKEIGGSAFSQTAIKDIVIPAGVEYLGAHALGYGFWQKVVVLNPNCVIEDSFSTLGEAETTTIYALPGSTAETYAQNNGFTFVSLYDFECENGKHISVNTDCALCGASAVETNIVINHTLNLANDISINYVVHESYLADKDSFYMEVYVPAYDGYSWFYHLDGEKRGQYYYFSMLSINAVQMNDIYEAKLVMTKDGMETYSAVDHYSVATYAYNQMNKPGAPEGLQKVCAELLRYGATAQLYKEYRTDALADERLTEVQKSYLTDLSTVTFNDHNRNVDDVEDPTVKWVGVSLDLRSRVTLRYIVDLTNYTGSVEDLHLSVHYTDIRGVETWCVLTEAQVYNEAKNWYAFDISYFGLAEMRTVLTAQVYVSGGLPVTCSKEYSIDTYCNGKTGLLGELCATMIAMSDSVADYFINN